MSQSIERSGADRLKDRVIPNACPYAPQIVTPSFPALRALGSIVSDRDLSAFHGVREKLRMPAPRS